jgi:hypothetical protein
MGSSTILDILSSIIIAGFLLLMVTRLNGTLVESSYTASSDLTVQENLVALVRIIEEDFRKIGYCKDPAKIPDPSKSILAADQHSITFLTDVDNNAAVDTLRYYVGTTAALTSTTNPRDMMLYRVINNQPSQGFSLGVTKFNFLYYDALADSLSFPIDNPNAIYSMRLSVLLESPFAYDQNYSFAYWRQLRLAARNLKNR